MDERTLRPTPGGPTARMVRESLGVRNKRRLQQVGYSCSVSPQGLLALLRGAALRKKNETVDWAV